jgi:hypothetical protein
LGDNALQRETRVISPYGKGHFGRWKQCHSSKIPLLLETGLTRYTRSRIDSQSGCRSTRVAIINEPNLKTDFRLEPELPTCGQLALRENRFERSTAQRIKILQ